MGSYGPEEIDVESMNRTFFETMKGGPPPDGPSPSISSQSPHAPGVGRAPGAGSGGPPLAEGPCPSCTALLDQLDGAVDHATQHINLAVVAKAPLQREEAEPLGTELQAMVEEGMATGGPRGALRRFVERYSGGTYAEGGAPLQERIFANAEVFFGVEMTPFVSFVPDVEALRRSAVPVVVMAGQESREALPEVYRPSRWLADRLGVGLVEIPGAHVPYFDRPEEFVHAIRPFLKEDR